MLILDFISCLFLHFVKSSEMSKALMKHKQELVVLEFLKNTYSINVS